MNPMDAEHERARDVTVSLESEPVRTPPRSMIRLFWSLHRGLHRLSGGRFGLSRPKLGKRFGMMRIDTVGRRSGKLRMAILGYFEDGPNLVTLAMNGWGETPPAWWLNLESCPYATVVLRDGQRRVHARSAVGPERARLWARVQEYPGWGADIDALAALRSIETPVVVLEPTTSGIRGPG